MTRTVVEAPSRTRWPQFDPDRDTSPAEDLADGDSDAAEAFVDWMADDDQRYMLFDLLMEYQNRPLVKSLINQWGEKARRQT